MNPFKYLFILCCCLCFCTSYVNADCTPTITVTFSEDGKSVTTISSKDLSNVVLKFCDGTEDFKFDNLSGKVGTFSLDDKQLSGVYVKSGCNHYLGENSPEFPGYGELFERECTTDCEGTVGGSAELDECGVCNGNGPGECGCDLNIVEDECGICGGPGEGPCGCNDLVRDECGVCGGEGPGECGCDLNTIKDECGICGGSGKDECGRCPGDEGPGTCVTPTPTPTPPPCVPDQCGFCPGDDFYEVGKDVCGICPGEEGYNSGTCIDCLGIPNGPNVKDRDGVCCEYSEHDECGRCDGPGKNECDSCDGDLTCTCENTSIFEESIQIDSYSMALYRETKKAGKALLRHCSSRKCKKLVKKLTLKASDLHMKIWTDIWTIGGEYTTCDPDACLVVDLTHIKQSLTQDYLQMQKGVRKLYKKAFRRSGGKKGIRRKLTRSNHKTKLILQLIDFILPNEKSVCN